MFYIDNILKKYCCLKTDEDPNDGEEYWFHNVYKIFLGDILVFTNSSEHIVSIHKV